MSTIFHKEITAGLLYRKEVREFLEKQKFLNSEIDFIEQKGWASSTFIFSGPYAEIDKMERSLMRWYEKISAEAEPK